MPTASLGLRSSIAYMQTRGGGRRKAACSRWWGTRRNKCWRRGACRLLACSLADAVQIVAGRGYGALALLRRRRRDEQVMESLFGEIRSSVCQSDSAYTLVRGKLG